MVNLRLSSPMARLFYRPIVWDDEEEGQPELTLTEGLDMYEDNDSIVVKAAVPGIPEDRVEVTFENGVLSIKARSEQSEEEKDKKRVVYRMDRVSSFQYTTTLPRPVDEKNIEAVVENGVVIVTARIAEAAKPKRITVKKIGK